MRQSPKLLHAEGLLERFRRTREIRQNALARGNGGPPRRINGVVLGKRGITAATALRFAAFFGTSEGFWLGLQTDYDLEEARGPIARELLRVERARAEYRAVRHGRRRPISA